MYSHRSTFLHSLMVTSTANIALAEHDRMLVIVPMFHANAWGTPYAAWMVGADLVFPQQFLQAAPLARIIDETRPTLTGAVPTVLTDLLNNGAAADLSSFRLVMCGGSAVPRALIEGYRDVFDVPHRAGLGDDRDQPGVRDRSSAEGHGRRRRDRPGGPTPAASCPASSCGSPTTPAATVAWDGESLGEIEVRGPWITASYYNVDDPEKFHDGWLRTGDVASVIAQRLRDDQRPRQGRDQVRRRVGVVGRSREHAHGSSRHRRGGGHRRARRALGRATAGVRRAASPSRTSRRPSCAVGWPSAPPSSGCPSAGRSSPRCPRPASASSTRRCCAPATRPTSSTSRSSPERSSSRSAAGPGPSGSASTGAQIGIDPLALEQLFERLGGLRDRVLGEEALHVGHQVRRRQRRDRVDHAHDRVVREPLDQLRPLAAHGLPGQRRRVGGWRCSGSAGTGHPASSPRPTGRDRWCGAICASVGNSASAYR